MKAVGCLVTLCLLAGFIAAEQYAWETGKTYTYRAHGRLLAGISEINTQYAGLEIQHTIQLTVIGQNRVHLKPYNIQVSEVNEEQDGGWRDVPQLKGETPVELPENIRQYLESPVEIKFNKGVVESIKVQGDLPNYAVNIKKAQVSHFILNSAGQNAILSGNLNRRMPNQVRPEDATTQSGTFFETMEETVLGECETYYTVSESGPYDNPRTDPMKAELAKHHESEENRESGEGSQEVHREVHRESRRQDRRRTTDEKDDSSSSEESQEQRHSKYMAYKDLIKRDSNEDSDSEALAADVFHSFCEGKHRLMEFTKTVNYSMCKNKPALGYASPSFILNGRAGDNSFGTALGRITYSRYIACGKDKKQLTILKIEQEEQIFKGILRKEKIIGGSIQNLTLIQILPSRPPVPIKDAKEIRDLTYTFDPREQKLRRDGKLRTAFEETNGKDSSEESSEENKSNDQSEGKSRPRRSAEDSEESSEEKQEMRSGKDRSLRWAQAAMEGKQYLKMPSMNQPPLNPMLASPLNNEGMKTRVGVLLEEIVRDVTDEKPLAEEETVSKIATVAKILRYLAYDDVEILYKKHADKWQTDDHKIRRKIFLDAVAMAGTNPNIKFLIDLMTKQNKDTQGEEYTQLVMTFSMYIRTPTPALIHYFFTKLVDFSPRPDNMDQFRTTAVLAFSNLLHDACVNSRIANTRYPVQIYGEFCDHQSVNREYLPQLVKQLRWALEQINRDEHSVAASHWATVFVTALGNTGHPSVIKEIQNILDTETDPYIKTKAVFALKRLVISRSNQNIPTGEETGADRKNRDVLTDEVVEKQVLPVLASVAFDKTESQEVRMAAIALIVKATAADSTIWQQLAYSTWFELNQEVHSYIYNIIWTLAHLNRPADPVTWTAHQRARAVLPLVKPIELGAPRSRTFHESAFYDEIQSGFMHQWSQFGSENSVLPNAIHYQNYKFLGAGAAAESPFEFNAHGHTISHIIEHLIGKLQPPTQSIVEGNDAIRQIAELLHIVDREQDETPQASIQIKLRDEMERIFSINREVVDQWIEQMKKHYFPQIITGVPVNYQKAMKLAEANYEFPTIFGIPVQTVLQSHNMISLRGSIKAIGTPNLKDVQVNADLHPIISYKTHSKITFKSPFSGKAYQAGVQHHAVFEFPFRCMFKKSAVGAFEFAITPTHLTEGSVSGAIDVFTFHRRPYTIAITDDLWPTSHKEGGQMKIVHAIDEPFKEVREFGQKAFGLAFTFEQETEFQPENERFPAWHRFLRRFQGTWGGWLHKGLMGAKTLRLAERKITLDVSQSKTKTLYFIAAGKYRTLVPHMVSESSSEENFVRNPGTSGESRQSSSSEEETAPGVSRQYYDKSSGDYQSYMNKKIKQRSYQDYQKSQSERQQKSEQKDSSEESSEEYEGQIKFPRNNRASYESDEIRDDEPETHHRHWVVVALLGKTTPLHAPLKLRGMQSHYENAPSAVQYLFSTDAFPGHAFVRVSSGEATKEHAAELPQNSAAVELIKRTVNSPLTNEQKPYCGDYTGDYEFPRWADRQSLLTLRQNLLREELKVKVRGEVSWGKSCNNKIHNVTFKGELKRDNEMLQWAKEESVEAKKCAEDEKKGFYSSPVCIINSEQQAAALNVAILEFRSTPLPTNVLNATLQVREFVKAFLYPYLSYDPIPIRPMNQRVIDEYLKVEARLTPQFDFLTLKFFRPTEQIFFEDIKLNQFARAILPFTATQTLRENVRDRVFKTQSSCSVEGTFVNTFDNVTYTFDPAAATNCKHVLIQDCSGKKAVSVLADRVGSNNLATTVLLPGNFRIELLPSMRQSEAMDSRRTYVTATTNTRVIPGQGRVLVNGVPVDNLPAIVNDKEGNFIARIEEAAGASLQLFSDDVQLTTDGRHIVVYPSQWLRNNTCGLCGNFDVSKTIDFRSPRDCQLSTGTLMMAAYAFQQPWDKKTNGECKIAEDVKQAIEKEERDCQSNEFIPVYAGNCKDQLLNQVGDSVYTIVRNALKYVPGVNGKKWAEKARNKVRELLQGHVNAKDIAEIVASGISKFIPYVGGVVKPLIKAAVQKIVEVICNKSGCCDSVWFF